jgi:xanthine/uracil permease
VVAAAGAIMIILRLLPRPRRSSQASRTQVLGRAALAMFATVAVVGIKR